MSCNIEINMSQLEKVFNEALENNARFVAVIIEIEGYPWEEVIVNPIENARLKLEYYKNTYNEDLSHKFAKGIHIVGFTYGNHMADIDWTVGFYDVDVRCD